MQTIAYVKNNLPQLVHQVEQGEPMVLTRRGKPVAVLQSYLQYMEDQQSLQQVPKRDWWDDVMDWRHQISTEFEGLTEAELNAGRVKDHMPLEPLWLSENAE
jgi:prevent-host-death family protein